MIIELEEDDYIAHYGILRKSGRYPWGSGEDQYSRNKGFLQYMDEMKKQGVSEKDIAKVLSGPTKSEEVSVALLRDVKTIALNENKLANIHQAEKLREKGMSNKAIAERMGLSGESSVRALLAPGIKEKTEQKLATSKMLKEELDRKKVVDVGRGVEANLNISAEQLRTAVTQLREQGYNQYLIPHPQATSGNDTKMKVLTLPDITQKEVWQNPGMIQQLDAVTRNGGKDWEKTQRRQELVSIDPKRVKVKFAEEGGKEADGVIFVRPGVDDISLGKARYAQVRIKVGDDHYLKGMAVYKDDLPNGTDLLFNTNKTRAEAGAKGDPKLGAMKPLDKENRDYPFGSVVRPPSRRGSAMNLVYEEGEWREWNRNISAQALSKQAPSLAKERLDQTYKARKSDYDDIMALTNPAVKKKLLETFSDATDRSATHLKAAALERQNWHVILPIKSLKPGEVYAPWYKDGETVVLIRYPHGGKFEIPELKVNNKNREARNLLGKDPLDAIGIHFSVADRLSGADFDGDTVLVIPNNNKRIKVDPALAGLKGFDAKKQFKLPEGHKSRINTQQEMGNVSNLITDMTIMGATNDHIARAVKHSMVVIDAAKHDLDHKRSAKEFGILELKRRYQGRIEDGSYRSGAATLISRAGSEVRLPARKPRPYPEGGSINRKTGALEFVPKGTVSRRTGKPILEKHKLLAVTDDAHDLVSVAGTRVEKIYADHSNRLKSLANQARLSYLDQPNMKVNPSAKKQFAPELQSLKAKLALATANAPRERRAQVIAKQVVDAEMAANPTLDKASKKKLQFRALTEARNALGVDREPLIINDREWAAIQAGAVSNNILTKILDKADMKQVKELATPRTRKVLSTSDVQLASRLLAIGYTRAQVAERLGVSIATIDANTMGDAESDDDDE